jgi:hypothetical protein
MHLHKAKIECLLPVFFGGFCSLALCAHLVIVGPAVPELALLYTIWPVKTAPEEEEIYPEISEIEEELPFEEEALRQFAETPEPKRDLIREMYREPEAREWVTEFFEQLCDSRDIAEIILANADEFNVPPALAFALSWEESRFNYMAVSKKNKDESVDRGLFQLNSRSFPRIPLKDFFDPQINAQTGMNHLRHCLDTGGSEIAALALYNAGTGKVHATGAPKHTLDYIHRILENRQKIETRFQARVQREAEARIAEKFNQKRTVVTPEQDMDFLLSEFTEKVIIVEAEPPRPRTLRLAPLVIR